MLIRHIAQNQLRSIKLSIRRNIHRVNTHQSLLQPFLISRNMSAAAHPVSSAADPAPPAEGLNPVTPKASDAAKAEAKQQKKDKKEKKGGGSSGPLELNPPPEFFAERIKIFDEYKAKYDKWVSGEIVSMSTGQCEAYIQNNPETPSPLLFLMASRLKLLHGRRPLFPLPNL